MVNSTSPPDSPKAYISNYRFVHIKTVHQEQTNLTGNPITASDKCSMSPHFLTWNMVRLGHKLLFLMWAISKRKSFELKLWNDQITTQSGWDQWANHWRHLYSRIRSCFIIVANTVTTSLKHQNANWHTRGDNADRPTWWCSFRPIIGLTDLTVNDD